MTETLRTPGLLGALARVRDPLAVWTIFFLVSGQGLRYLLGIPGYAALAALTVVAIALAYPTPLRLLRPPVFIGFFVGLATMSVLWSATRSATLLAVVTLIATTYLAIVITRSTTIAHFMVLLYRGFQVSLFVGVVFELIVSLIIRHPIGPLSHDLVSLGGHDFADTFRWSYNRLFEGGDIQGFVGNRNPFAAIALFTLIGVIILALDRRISLIDAAITGITAAAVLMLTQSATVTIAALYMAGLLVAGLLIRFTPPRMKRAFSFTILGVTATVAVLALKYRVLIFGMLDRRPDATNRVGIWRALFEYALQRPEGWGYVAYWPVYEEPYASIVKDSPVFVAPHGHNAFLDAWLQLGFAGAALLLTIVLLTFLSAWRLVERANRGDSFIPLGWVLMTSVLALQAITESRLISEWGWFLLVALYYSAPGALTLAVISDDMVRTGDRSPAAKRSNF